MRKDEVYLGKCRFSEGFRISPPSEGWDESTPRFLIPRICCRWAKGTHSLRMSTFTALLCTIVSGWGRGSLAYIETFGFVNVMKSYKWSRN